MAKPMRIMSALVASVSVLALCGTALAQMGTGRTPTQADFDFCNAQANTGGSSTGGSASPSTPGTTSSGSAGTGPATSGSVGVGSSQSSSVGAGAAAGNPTTGGSTLGTGGSSVGSSAAGDSQLRGMAVIGSTNPLYQQAYRDCMTKRGY